MSLAHSLLPEYDHEIANLRRMLERVPMDRAAWRPHPRSMPLGRLASHLAEIPQWAVNSCLQDELDFAPPGAKPYEAVIYASTQELLAKLDEHAKAGRDAIAQTSDDEFLKPWTLKMGGEPQFTMPKVAVLRAFVLSHLIHHRGQLSVFLRLLDVPVPGSYGPSADES